jgi:hypothetical protein
MHTIRKQQRKQAQVPVTEPPQTVAPATQASVVPVVTESVPATTVTTVAAATTAPQEQQVTATPAEKKTRQPISEMLELGISPARCNHHLRSNIHSTLRVSGTAPVAVATICDLLTTEMLKHGMDQAMAANRKIVEVRNYHTGDLSKYVTYPLFQSLKSYTEYSEAHEEALKAEQSAQNKAAKEAREAKKLATAAQEEKPAEPTEQAKTPGEGEASFVTYVENVLKSLKGDEKYASMRVSNRVREDLSNIIIETVERFARLTEELVTKTMKVRTIGAAHILAVLRLLMVDSCRSPEQIASLETLVNTKVDAYLQHRDQSDDEKSDEPLNDEAQKQKMHERVQKGLAQLKRRSERLELQKQELEKQIQ